VALRTNKVFAFFAGAVFLIILLIIPVDIGKEMIRTYNFDGIANWCPKRLMNFGIKYSNIGRLMESSNI